jgi:hypothetical protein
MVVTRARLRELLGRSAGFFFDSTTTSQGNSGGTTLIDTAILKYDTAELADKWLLQTSGNNDGEARRITSVSSSTITVTSAYTNRVESGVTYEIVTHDPDTMQDALQQAGRTIYPDLYLKLTDETIIVDNLLANSSFEDSQSIGTTSAFADNDSTVEGTTLVTDASHGLSTNDIITINGSNNYDGTWRIVVVSSSTFYIDTPFVANDATVTWVNAAFNQEGTASGWALTSGTWTFPSYDRVVHGKHSATDTPSGSDAQLTQNLFETNNLIDSVGKTLHVRGFAFATSANVARLRVTSDNGSTFTSSTFHRGDDEMEYLDDLNFTIPAGVTSLTVYAEIADGNTAWFDLIVAWISEITQYNIPEEFVNGPHRVEMQARAAEPNGQYLPLSSQNPAISGRILRLIGMGYLTVPTSDTQVMELDEPRAELLVAEAAIHLYRRLRILDPGNQEQYVSLSETAHRELGRLRAKPGLRMKPLGGNEHEGWRIDSGSRMLLLDR